MKLPAVTLKLKRIKTLSAAWPRTYASGGRLLGSILASRAGRGSGADQARSRSLPWPRSWSFAATNPELSEVTNREPERPLSDAEPDATNGTGKAASLAAEEAASLIDLAIRRTRGNAFVDGEVKESICSTLEEAKQRVLLIEAQRDRIGVGLRCGGNGSPEAPGADSPEVNRKPGWQERVNTWSTRTDHRPTGEAVERQLDEQ